MTEGNILPFRPRQKASVTEEGFYPNIEDFHSNNPYVSIPMQFTIVHKPWGLCIGRELGLFQHLPEWHAGFLEVDKLESSYRPVGPPVYHGLAPKDFLHLV